MLLEQISPTLPLMSYAITDRYPHEEIVQACCSVKLATEVVLFCQNKPTLDVCVRSSRALHFMRTLVIVSANKNDSNESEAKSTLHPCKTIDIDFSYHVRIWDIY